MGSFWIRLDHRWDYEARSSFGVYGRPRRLRQLGHLSRMNYNFPLGLYQHFFQEPWLSVGPDGYWRIFGK